MSLFQSTSKSWLISAPAVDLPLTHPLWQCMIRQPSTRHVQWGSGVAWKYTIGSFLSLIICSSLFRTYSIYLRDFCDPSHFLLLYLKYIFGSYSLNSVLSKLGSTLILTVNIKSSPSYQCITVCLCAIQSIGAHWVVASGSEPQHIVFCDVVGPLQSSRISRCYPIWGPRSPHCATMVHTWDNEWQYILRSPSM